MGADEMRALGKEMNRGEQLGDFGPRVGLAEDRQAEGRFRDEDVAGNEFEGLGGRVRLALVVARDHDAVAGLDHDLGRAEDVARGREAHPDAADLEILAIGRGLGPPGEARVVTDFHQPEGSGRREHSAVAGAGMVGVPVRDEGPGHGAQGIDMETAGRAVEPGGRVNQHLAAAHVVRSIWFAFCAGSLAVYSGLRGLRRSKSMQRNPAASRYWCKFAVNRRVPCAGSCFGSSGYQFPSYLFSGSFSTKATEALSRAPRGVLPRSG